MQAVLRPLRQGAAIHHEHRGWQGGLAEGPAGKRDRECPGRDSVLAVAGSGGGPPPVAAGACEKTGRERRDPGKVLAEVVAIACISFIRETPGPLTVGAFVVVVVIVAGVAVVNVVVPVVVVAVAVVVVAAAVGDAVVRLVLFSSQYCSWSCHGCLCYLLLMLHSVVIVVTIVVVGGPRSASDASRGGTGRCCWPSWPPTS